MTVEYPSYRTPFAKRKEEIQEDINRILNTLESDDSKALLAVHIYIDAKYQGCIVDWGKSFYAFSKDFGFNYNNLDEYSLKHNLCVMNGKLEAFKNGWNILECGNVAPKIPDINVNTTTNVNISITFEQVRNNLQEMTSLTMDETQEAISKVNEIENIANSGTSKKEKWEKAKPILKWLLDKSCDVGISLLPLFLKLQ